MKLRYSLDVNYDNKARLVDFFVLMYAYASKIEIPSNREMGILRDYIMYGYSRATKDIILANTPITIDNLNVIGSNLQKKGYLLPHPTNLTMRVLNKDLQVIANTIESFEGNDCALIKFIKSGS